MCPCAKVAVDELAGVNRFAAAGSLAVGGKLAGGFAVDKLAAEGSLDVVAVDTLAEVGSLLVVAEVSSLAAEVDRLAGRVVQLEAQG